MDEDHDHSKFLCCDCIHKDLIKRARERVIKDVEDTFAEFGEQSVDVVAGILGESFHGKREVEY